MSDNTKTFNVVPDTTEDRAEAAPSTARAPSEGRLGDALQEARRDKGLELSEVAEATHVRKEYLKALDEGNYDGLPEDIYTKNFVRLYAKAVGLDESRALQLYNRDRGRDGAAAAVGGAGTGVAPSGSATAAPTGAKEPRRQPRAGASFNIGGLLATLILIGALVGLAVWGFNNLLFPNPTRLVQPSAEDTSGAASTTSGDSGGVAATSDGETVASETPPADTVFFSIVTTPPGAQVSIDNYAFPTTTPIEQAPVTAGENRQLRVSMEGFQTYEAEIDLSFDRNLSVALTPLSALADETTNGATANAANEQSDTPVAAGEGEIVLTIDAASWLEVYEGSSRGAGSPLVYRTVQPGQTLTFELPVYLHVGNAGGIQYSVSGQERGRLGSNGEVVSRAFVE